MAQSHGDEGPDLAPRGSDLATAEYLGRRVAAVAHRWVWGGMAVAGDLPAERPAAADLVTAG